MQHCGGADAGTEVPRIGGDGEQRLGCGAEQQIIDNRLVLRRVSDAGPSVIHPRARRAGIRKPAGKEPAGGGRAVAYGDLTERRRAGGVLRALEEVVDRRLPPAGSCRCGLQPSDFGVTVCMVPTISGEKATVVRHGRRRPPAGGGSDKATTAIMGLRSRPRFWATAERVVPRRLRRSRRLSCGRRNKGMAGDGRQRRRWPDRCCRPRPGDLAGPARRSAPWRARYWPCSRRWRVARSGGCGETPSAERGAGSA